MTVQKAAIDPSRIRTIPAEGFSWVDRRFIREGFIEALPPEAILLYFFLTAVSDARGLSFYADPSISKRLKLNAQQLSQSRQRLMDRDLVLYRYPIYQVLALPEKHSAATAQSAASLPRGGEPLLLREIFKRLCENSPGEES